MNLIYSTSLWFLLIGLLLFTFVANYIGYLIGRLRPPPEGSRTYAFESTLKATVFALVGLMVGFTYATNSSRHYERQILIVEEANAISTCYARAGILPQPSKDRVRSLLRQYTDLRINLYVHGIDRDTFRATTRDIDKLSSSLWSAVEEAAAAAPDITRNSEIVPATNALLDNSTRLKWIAEVHAPLPVVLMLTACLIVSSALIGHSAGQLPRPAFGLWIIQNLLLVILIFIILDFDRPLRGLVQINLEPLIVQRQDM